jgi:hypothetical protein
MMDEQEYQDAKKMGSKMMQGGPGGCKGKQECDAFCQKEENFQACMDFGHDNGFMSDEEYAQAKKMGPKALKGGPGGCQGKEECEGYCDNPAHSEACIKFAEENGLLSQEEIQKMKQGGFMVPPGGGDFTGPGGCKTQQECMAFCSQKENDQICKMFGAGPQIGLAQDTFKNGGAGPGGCNSPEACMVFCSDKANQETCMNFRPPERVKPPEDFQEGQDPNQKQTGPGGCASPEECEAYCSAHREECGAPPPPDSGNGEGDRQMPPGDFQVPRIEPGQNQFQQPSSGGGDSGQGMGLSGEQVERMELGQPEFGIPPLPGEGQQPGQIEQVPLVQQQAPPPSGGGEIQPLSPVFQPAPQIEQAPPPIQQLAPQVEQAPPPAEPAPQAMRAPRLLVSALSLLASALNSFFGR